MNFHSLSRRELQFLCKRNKIPANITNVAMADALTALQHVEGIEEMMNSDVMQSPALTQARGTKTPATITNHSKAPTASACRKLDAQMKEEEEEGTMATPALASSRRRAPTASASIQRTYSTRRSVKLLQETMAELTLNEEEKPKADLFKDSKDSSDVPDVIQQVEEKDMSGTESVTQTPEESNDISVSYGNQDKNEISKNDETVDEYGAGEFSSEANSVEEVANSVEEVAKDLSGVSTGKFSMPQESQDLANEYNQLNASDGVSEYPEEVCENMVGQDSDINMGQADEHKEKKDDGTMVPSSEVELPLDLPEGIEDWDSQTDWSDKEEENDDKKVSDMKPAAEAVKVAVLPEVGISKAKVTQTPALPKDEIDYEFDFEMEEDTADSENLNGLMESDTIVKNKASPPVEAEFSVPTFETPPLLSQLSGDEVTDENPTQQTMADNVMLPYQFLCPSQATPMKSSPTKLTPLSDDKENTENSNMEVDGKDKVNEASIALDPNTMSMRQMKKKLKELELKKKSAMQQGEKMAAVEQEKN